MSLGMGFRARVLVPDLLAIDQDLLESRIVQQTACVFRRPLRKEFTAHCIGLCQDPHVALNCRLGEAGLEDHTVELHVLPGHQGTSTFPLAPQAWQVEVMCLAHLQLSDVLEPLQLQVPP